jgi:hypothetical protein
MIIIKTKVLLLQSYVTIVEFGYVLSCSQHFLNYLVSNPLTLSAPNIAYSKNGSCALQ